MEEQKKYFIISTIMFVVIAIVILQVDKYHDHKVRNSYTLETNKLNNQYINLNDFGIYLQNAQGTYDKQPNNNYPTQGYILNTSRTECFDYHGVKQTNKVSQTDEGRVRLETTTSIYCKMYFDIDNTKPTITSMSVTGTDKDSQTRSDYIYNYGINYTFVYKDDDVVYYCVKEGSAACSESEWKKVSVSNKTISGSLTVSTSDGAKTINAYVRDRAKNVSAVVNNTSNKTITLDRTAPTISEFTLTGKDSGNQNLTGYTYNKTINYSVKWSETDVAQICVKEGTGSCTSWVAASGTSKTGTVTITSSGEGSKTISVYLKDKTNNISTVNTQSIILDTTPPKVTLTLKGTQASGTTLASGYTHTTSVSYTGTITETNINKHCVGENSCSSYSSTTSKTVTGSLTIGGSEGEHTIAITIKDKANNSVTVTSKINLDLNNPSVSISGETSTTDTITYTMIMST